MINIYYLPYALIILLLIANLVGTIVLFKWSNAVDEELDMLEDYCHRLHSKSNALDTRESLHYAQNKNRINAHDLKLIGWRDMCTDITLTQSRQQAEIEAIKMVLNEEEGDN